MNAQFLRFWCYTSLGFPGGSAIKNPLANGRDIDLIPGLERLPVEGNGNLSSILTWKNPIDRRAIGSQRIRYD